ncbi:Hint domain-containing protein [Acetobacter indonesiensis]|uniref:Hint domain-containing protein n=1 Tax=Acetobacter indonesiensis TaxID=104101 RepID=UPI0020A38FAC|nr:Hint domain-containing protein [Acetobacter indonesiensis]MCP1229927.1 Hint domain-containing protein [Acetobacter indonesiensis]
MATGDLFSSFESGAVNFNQAGGANVPNGGSVTGSISADGATATLNLGYVNGNNGAGNLSGATANFNGVLIARSDRQTITSAIINSGGAAVAANGGVISGATVSSGGGLEVAAGASGQAGKNGTIIDPHVLSGGVVAAGAFTAKGTTFTSGGVISGGTFEVGSLEMVSAARAVGGDFKGTQLVLGGGVASGGIFHDGGLQLIGGYWLSATDGAGGTTMRLANAPGTESGWVANQSVASGAQILAGGTAKVLAGGTSISGTVASGGTEVISSGGIASGTIVSGGTEIVQSGGLTSGATVVSGGTEILSGGTASATIVGSGGSQLVSSGGTAVGAVVSGGIEQVASGGTALRSVISAYGNATVSAGGYVSGTIVGSNGGLGVQGIASNTTVSGGGVVEIASGGTATTNSINGGKVYVDSAGVLNTTTISSGGTVTVSNGGIASGTVISAFGAEIVSAGGYVSGTVVASDGGLGLAGSASNTTVSAGGVVDVSSGGTATTTTVQGGSVYAASGAVLSATTISANGSVTVSGGAQASQSTIGSGGTLTAASGGTLIGTVTVSGGATLALGGNNGNAVIDLAGTTASTPAKVIIASGVTDVPEQFTSWSDGDQIIFSGVSGTPAASDISFGDADHITFKIGGTSYTLNIVGIRDKFKFVGGASELTLETCFLTGTLIRMLDGQIAVEDVRPGDTVMVRKGDAFVPTTVKWVGKNKSVVRSDAAYTDEAGYPVLIMKDALADGVPFKDLRVTPEHCLFIDGQFIPARMLVNGRSIRYDTNYAVYDYYHIETEDHSVIEADGVLTETYLDTGNRASFARIDGSDVVSGYFDATKDWAHDAAAPLATSRDVVEPVHKAIAARSAAVAQDVVVAEDATWSDDANLHLETENGSVIRAMKQANNTVSFMLPPGVQKVFITSRTSRPVDVFGAFVDDRRELGVQIGKIELFSGVETVSVSSHLETETLEGWAAQEDNATARWTSGRAVVDLSGASTDGFRMLTLDVVSTVSYRVNDQKQTAVLSA